MIRRIILLLSAILCVLPFYVGAQTKTLTIDDAVVGVWRNLYPEMIYGIQIRPDTKTCTKWDGRNLVEFSFDKKKTTTLFALEELVAELKSNDITPVMSYPDYKWLSKNEMEIHVGNSVCIFDVVKKKIKSAARCDDDVENATYCAANSSIAYTVDNNLLIRSGSKIIKVSDEKDSNIVYGQTVHRNEFGIDGGIFWSPNGNYLAFYRKDNSKVSDYPIVDVNERVAKLKPEKYCMAGMDSEEVTVGVFDMKTQKIIYLDVDGPKDQFLTMVTWSPDEKSIYVGVLNREQNHLQMRRYNATTGKFEKLLFEEKNDRYVEPQHPLTFLPNDPEKFIYWSRKDGFWHLYLYNIDGKQISQITKGEFEVQEIYGFANKNQDLIINANKETPIDFTIYKVNIATGNMTLISGNSGKHDAILSGDGEYLVDSYESTTVPREYILYQTSTGKAISTLLTAENPLAKYKMPTLKIGTIKADDGKTDLYYRLITPPDFDPNKKYPAIVYVYGGPHAQMITNSRFGGAAGWDMYMAQEGYVMFTLDNRGSANRGFEFESCIHRQLGTIETRDQMTGVEFLKSLGYVDMDRLGVHGWSFGGFMTTTLMTDCADVFKVGVAGGPVIDWKYYEVMYGERYMDTPQENPEGYEKASLLNKADKLKGRLMIIHGCIDPVVVWQHSLQFLNKCIEKKILVDYFVYPNHEHNVRGLDRVHLMRTITRYFDDHLK